ncbi:L,D-transpeptidase family protein [Sphingomonas xinjiangensis]|uniref:Murein L,D-transpeptidase YcbB/YkuD n=1 Tax=Sphingomonas xinjiangensis TaxID=643568 RepID=A0A840YQ32_9SPHN|nr:L,D-transpeptidase family protein [Sphingomonas xinjiangensis]MBB5710023.1 murein L,D-transpeptidase YcbB/YkuD [Sphingomonas xinjiangensis]
MLEQASGWSEASKSALLSALGDRSRHGLDHVSFLEADDGASDAELNQAALRFARALARGVVDPATLHDPFTLSEARVDEAALQRTLAAAVAKGRIGEWLASLAPQDEEYARLSQAYLDLSAQPRDGGSPPLGGKLLKVGTSDARVPMIIEQLTDGGYLPIGDVASRAASGERGIVYTHDIAGAVKRLQRDFGIAADGVIGPKTVGVLNLSPGDRARAVAVALERRRWLSRTPPPTRIDVNTAAARLRYYRDGVLADTRRVVVGKPGTETPLLQSPIYRLVANPTWTVPKSIQNGELANVGADYLARNNMTVRGGWIVQGPGPQNALGLVKFDMINKHAIYLHDTSAPELFDRSQRHRSHGCVRVEDALGFAQMLAQDQGVTEEWQAAQTSGEQRFVPLKSQIPVRLLYRNVFIGDDGQVAYRTDPYGWNAPIAKALGFPGRAEARLRSGEADIAP